jgi:UDP-N-acetyl-2-amino-2-deoxyglucuronate dehydrogenase
MAAEPFRAALIGTGGFGGNVLRALAGCPGVTLAGVADLDGAAAATAAAEAHCPCYADNRRLLVESRAHGLFLAVPPAPAAELARLAAGRGVHVWKGVPLARNLHEAVALCRATESAGLKFAVCTERRFMGGYRRAKQLLEQLGRAYLVQAHYAFNWGAVLGWRGDKAAGGGALLTLGYHMFDLVVWLLGLPEIVYSIASARRRDRGDADQPVYDTEDTAVALLGYADKLAATITVSRCFSPVSEGLTIYGESGSIAAGPNRCALRDRDGTTRQTFQEDEPPAGVFARQVEAFVHAVRAVSTRYACSGHENLLTMAAIEAAYLSDQTHQGESPAGLLARNDLTPAECLKFAPLEEEDR